jgi:hypothetical protein
MNRNNMRDRKRTTFGRSARKPGGWGWCAPAAVEQLTGLCGEALA